MRHLGPQNELYFLVSSHKVLKTPSSAAQLCSPGVARAAGPLRRPASLVWGLPAGFPPTPTPRCSGCTCHTYFILSQMEGKTQQRKLLEALQGSRSSEQLGS